jgi:cell division protein FtsA
MVSSFTWFKEQSPRPSGHCTAVVDLGACETRVSLIDDEGCALAYVFEPSCGLADDGAVVEIDRCGDLLTGLIARAEALGAHQVDRLVITVSDKQLFSFSGVGFAGISAPTVQVSDLSRAAENAVFSQDVAVGQRLIHALPTEFILDGQHGIEDPVGLSGYRLSVRFFWVFCQSEHVENLNRLCERAGLPEPELIAAPLAAAMGGLTRDEAMLGSVVIDLGHSCSSLTAWSDGAPVLMGHVAAGGRHLGADLRHVFKLSAEQSQQLILSGIAGVSEMETAGDSANIGRRRIDRHKSARVLQARFEDIFQRARNLLTTKAWWRVAENGVVLTGGAAQIPGVERLAEIVLQCPVRIASMESIERDWTWPPVNAEVVSFRECPERMVVAGGLEFVRMNHLNYRNIAAQRPWPAPDVRDLHEAFLRMD